MALSPSVKESLLAAIPKLRTYAMSLCRSKDAAEDLVQTTLVRACAGISQFDPGSNMEAWLFTILRNHFYGQYRHRQMATRAMKHIGMSGATNPQQLASMEFRQVGAAIARLPEKLREALLLVGAGGYTYQEAANLCNCPVGTVKSRVNRARDELACMLSIQDPEYFGPDTTFSAVLGAQNRLSGQQV